VSGQLYRIMTPKSQTYLREIDRVTVKGSIEPIELFTCDVDYSILPLEPLDLKKPAKKDAKIKRVKARLARDRLRELAYDGQIQVSSKFETDKDLVLMR